MTTEPDQIRAQITELLADVAESPEADSALAPGDLALGDSGHIDAVAARLEQAHDLLVRALESVEKG